MGYCICYESKKHPWEQRRSHRRGLLIGVLICLVLIAAGFLLNSRIHLFPEDRMVTQAALEAMTTATDNGATFSDAFLAFCQEVLNHAQSS